ncbi:transcriptional regulator, AsnC family [Halobiforma haloterrestris]|uniref:siroheme decarboxylase n=1 Tax=Natronobacterium haloterrestre TaxID=148448 RepID=A0A1I1EJ06_NATHA|nr:Lrp/AsnC family transcriptional regulator [Halobiforma haloterrestris]SFB84980.1 transcriptional regulator, AsnC family [Halobiforma haloterrestris]
MDTDVALVERERAVVNAFQGGFPVAARPFEPAAAALRARGVDVSAGEVLGTIRDLSEREVLSRFGPLIDAEAIGGTAVLAATSAPDDRVDEIAETINARREVAHNYERDHPELNLWFVVSVADADRVPEVLTEIEAATGRETYAMPKRREFELEARFPVDGPLSDESLEIGPGADEPSSSDTPADASSPLSPAERDLVLEVQDGLPLSETPYADVAAAIDRDPDWVRETIRRFDREGKIRRVGVVPNHYALGYTENGMTVWDVPDDLVSEVGPAVASLPFVTHCYERPRHEGVWSYNLFAMVHGRSEGECRRRIERVRETVAEYGDVRDDDWETLFSTRILKKTGIRLTERVEANTRPDTT